MDDKAKAAYQLQARVIKALAHPTRLFIVDQLAKSEMCVSELTELVGTDVSTVSRHLAVLRGVGIVADAKRANQVFYSLRVPCVLKFFSCVESVLRSVAREREDLVG